MFSLKQLRKEETPIIFVLFERANITLSLGNQDVPNDVKP